jgi:hypothetical protein
MLKLGILPAVLVVFAAGAVYLYSQATLTVVQLYYLREMLAALVLFSIGFAVVVAVIVFLFLLDRGVHRAVVGAAPNTARAALRLHRGVGKSGLTEMRNEHHRR